MEASVVRLELYVVCRPTSVRYKLSVLKVAQLGRQHEDEWNRIGDAVQ